MNMDANDDAERPVPDIPRWEWICAWAGALLVAGTLLFLGYDAATSEPSPPDIGVRIDGIQPVRAGFLVHITAENRGETTAAGVRVEGVLESGGAAVEASEATFDYLPPHSPRSGGLYFARDPRRHALVVSARGYARP